MRRARWSPKPTTPGAVGVEAVPERRRRRAEEHLVGADRTRRPVDEREQSRTVGRRHDCEVVGVEHAIDLGVEPQDIEHQRAHRARAELLPPGGVA
jgi:hypothetical protein